MNKSHFLKVLVACSGLLLGACVACAQTGAQIKNHPAMTVADVVRLAKAGLSEEIILAQIREKHPSFDLTADQLIELKSASVSERIIRVMLETPASEDGVPSASFAERTERPPAKLQWITHHDPMGFSVSSPAGWEVRADRQAGQIHIRGPHAEQAIIWPMFLQQQQLDSSGAGVVVQQLARRVDGKMAWGAPQPSGNAVRVFAHGQNSGAALMRWNSTPEGTAVYLFCVIAPAAIYPASVDTFAAILKSFQVVPDPQTQSAPSAKGLRAAEPVAWVRWTDPREAAFTASVPQGWNVSGGAFRQSATDIRKSVVLVSPDRQIRLAVGDANVGVYTAPNPMYARAGMREGGYAALGDGTKLMIRRFLPTQQFVREYVTGAVRRECGEPRILAENDRPDLAASAAQQARAQGASNPQVSAAGVSFSCTWNGQEARGYYAAATIWPLPGRSGIWYVDSLYGYLAVAERQAQADDISRHVLNSMGINAQWKQREDQIAGNAVQQDNARSQEIQARARQSIADNQKQTSDMIVKGYQERSKVYDEISRKRENSILGTVDVVDPASGAKYKIDNYSNYHWMNNQGVIAGTKTDSAPGQDWRQMITLP